jgi:hypothetical protein
LLRVRATTLSAGSDMWSYSHRMATEDEHPSQPDIAPDIAAMLTDQTRACKAAHDAIASGGQVVVWDVKREPPSKVAAQKLQL